MHIVTDNVIVGNLVIRSDPTFGGGELNVQGNYYNFFLVILLANLAANSILLFSLKAVD